jgi:hypothetical protein
MTREKQQLIINNTIKVFGPREWFRDVIVYPKHPESSLPTIEFRVNYHPLMEQKDVAAFALSAGCSYFFTVVDKDGNKAN